MSKQFFNIIFFFLITLFFIPTLIAQDKINFLRVDFPPLWIVNDNLKGKGIADAGEDFIKLEFPAFSYSHLKVTVARAQAFMSNKYEKTYCAVPHGKGFFKNVVESKVWVAISGHVLVSTDDYINKLKSNSSILNNKKQLLLKKFLIQSKDIGIITKEQRYPILDELLTPYKPIQIKSYVSSKMLSLYDMVLRKRVNYTFQYESTVKYLQKLNHDIHFITIEELNRHKVPIVVGCNDTPLARKFISELDKKIDKLRVVGLQKMKEFHSPITFKNIKDFVPNK